MAIDLSTLSAKEAITAIYAGYFDRAPDPAGLNYWIGELESGNLTLAQIATSFSTQVESTTEYPYFLTPNVASAQAFLTQVYVNLFNRGPDAAGLTYWTNELVSGNQPVGQIILSIISGATNSAAGNDIDTIMNKIEVGCDWVQEAADAGINAVPFTDDPEAVAGAKDALDGVTDDPNTVTAAKLETDAFIAGYGNDDPVTTPKTVSADEDATLNSFVEATDPDGDTLTYAVAPSGTTSNGTLVMNADGSFVYTPNANFVGTDSFTYSVSDGNGGSATGTVTINVNNTNDAPIASNVVATTAEDNAVTVVPSFTDIDAGDSATFSIGSNPANGTVVVNANGTFTYTPDANFNGQDSFQYIVTDAAGATSIATAEVTVTAVDDAPVANDSAAAANEGGAVVNGTVSASDIDSGSISFALTAAAPAGLTFNNNGTFSFDPTVAAYNSLDEGDIQVLTVNFTATADGQSDTGTLTITVTGTNDAPTASAVTATGAEDGGAITVTAITSDVDADDTATFSVSANPANGTVVNNNDGTFSYTPNANFNGTDSFQYTVTDSQGASASATATITVTSVNDAPVLADESVSSFEDEVVTGQLTATDVDGDTLTYSLAQNGGPNNGSLTLNADGSYTYTPNADFNGTDSFTVVVNDGNGGVDTATVTLNIAPVDDVLTVAIDDIAGGTGDDLFLGNGQTLNPGDSIDGGDGNDTLFVATTGANILTAFLTSNLENFVITTDTALGGGNQLTSVDFSSTSGILNTRVENSTQPVDLRFIEVINGEVNVALDNLTSNTDVLIDGRNSALAAVGAQALNLTIGGSQTTNPDTGDIVVDAGFETVNIVTTDAPTDGIVTVSDLQTDVNTDAGSPATPANGASTVNIDADDAALVIATDLDAGVTTVDASASSNNVTFSAAQNDNVARDLDGGEGNDNITGGDGNDDIDGNGGNDTIDAQDGNDDVSGGEGNDSILGGNGDDTLRGDNGNDTINGQAGNDDIFGGDGDDVINTGGADSAGGTEFVDAGDGDDVVTTDGTDLVGRAFFDDLDPNNTPLDSTDDVDQFDGGEGDDELIVVGSNPASEQDGLNDVQDFETVTLQSGRFDFTIGNNSVFENDHDARVAGGSSTTIDGRFANQDVDVDASTLDEAITLLGGTQNDELIGGRGNDTISGENAFPNGSNGGNDNMQGGDGDDTFLSTAENLDGGDTIEGDDGDDTLVIQSDGNRTANGAQFNATPGDVAQINGNITGIETLKVEDLSDTTDEGDLTVNFSGFDNADNIFLSHDFEPNSVDAVTPRMHVDGSDMDAGENLTVIMANNGQDTDIQITGGAGDDEFTMGSFLDAGDEIDGGDGEDNVTITESSVGDFANVSNIECITVSGMTAPGTLTFGADAEAAFAPGVTPIIKLAAGSTGLTIDTTAFSGPVIIVDNDGDNTFNTGGGDDTIIAAEGTDTFNTNGGDDTIVVSGSDLDITDVVNTGGGNDTVEMDNSTGAVTAVSNLSTNSTVENYVLTDDGDRFANVFDGDDNSLTFVQTGANPVTSLTEINVDATALTDPHDTFTMTLDASQTDADFAYNVEGSATADTLDKQNVGVDNNIDFNGNDGADNFILDAGDAGSTTIYDGGDDGSIDMLTISGGQITDDGFVAMSNVEQLKSSAGVALMAELGAEADEAGIVNIVGSDLGDDVSSDSQFNNDLTVTTNDGDDTFDFGASTSTVSFFVDADETDANDNLTGGSGTGDNINIDADNGDTADISSVNGVETVNFDGDTFTFGAVNGLVVGNTTNDNVDNGLVINDTTSFGDQTTNIDAGSYNGPITYTGDDAMNNVTTGNSNDTISTGDGDDTVTSQGGADTVLLGDGDDVAFTGAGADVVDAGADDDYVDAGDNNDTVNGNDGDDTIVGGDHDTDLGEVLTGGAGDDQFNYVNIDDSRGLVRDIITDFDQDGDDCIAIETQLIFQSIVEIRTILPLIPDNASLTTPFDPTAGINFAGVAANFSDAQGAISLNSGDGKADYVLELNAGPNGEAKLWVDMNDDGVLNGRDLQIFLDGADASNFGNNEVKIIDTIGPIVDSVELGISEDRLAATETLTSDAPVAPAAPGDAFDDTPATPLQGFLNSIDTDGTAVTYAGGGSSAYGTLTIDPVTGEYEYTYVDAAVEALDDGETVTDSYTITVTDNNGNTSTGTITVTINGADDNPTLAAVTGGTIIENGAQTGLTGTLVGADVDIEDIFYGIQGGTVNDNGTSTDRSDDVVTLDNTYGTLTVNAGSGAYEYTPDAAAIETLAAGQVVTDTFTVTVDDDDADAPITQTYSVVITGTNDDPIISVEAGDSAAETIDETDGTLTANDTLTVRDVDITDTISSSVSLVSAISTGVQADLDAVATGGMLTVAPVAGLAAEVTDINNLNWFFNSAGEAFNFLAVGETATLTYEVTVDDGNGGTDTQNVVITINGTNDDPVISVLAGDENSVGLTEQVGPGAGIGFTGSLTVRDIDTTDTVDSTVVFTASSGTYAGPNVPGNAALDAMFSVIPAANLPADQADGPGNLTWIFNSGTEGFDFLAVGETLVLTYTLTVTDGNGGFDTEAIDVTITGTNDAPDITVELGDSAAESVTETVGTPSAGLTSSGTLTVRDLDDSDTVTNAVTGVTTASSDVLIDAELASIAATLQGMMTVNAGPIAADAAPVADINNILWDWDSGAQGFDFLGAGDTATLTYTVESTDTQGATDTQTVAITITGTNDDPVIIAPIDDTATVTEIADGALGEGVVDLVDSGTITFEDLDVTDTHSATITTPLAITGGVVPPGAPASLGTFTIGAVNQAADTVTWTFTVNDAAVEYLDDGEALTQTATITIDDGNGGTVTETVTVTINGSNDVPTLTVEAGDSAAEAVTETNAPLTTNGTLSAEDIDISDAVTATATLTTDAVDVGAYVAPTGAGMMTVTAGSIPADPGDTNNVAWTWDSGAETFDGLDGGETLTYVYTVTVTDDSATTANQTVTVTVNGSHDTAIGADDTMLVAGVNITEDAGDTAADAGLFDNETFVDVNDDATNLRVTLLDGTTAVPNGGSVSIALSNGGILTMNSDGTYTFDPNGSYEALDDGEVGVETVQVTILDIDSNTTYTTTLTINIDGVNDAPIAVNDSGDSFTEDDGVTLGTVNVLANDSDPDVEPITAVAAATTSAAGADVVVNADGTYTYDASSNPGFQALAVGESTTDTFTYQVTDGDATSTATVTVTITGANDAPTAVADTGATDEDTVLNVGPLVGIVSNDTDPDASDTLTVGEVDGSAANVGVATAGDTGGLFTINADGSYSFDPDGDYDDLAVGETRDSQISYQVTDGNGGVSTSTVTVTVSGVNDAPVIGTIAATATGFDISVTDADTSDTLSFVAADQAGNPANDGTTFNYAAVTGAATLNQIEVTDTTATDSDDSSNETWGLFQGTAGADSAAAPTFDNNIAFLFGGDDSIIFDADWTYADGGADTDTVDASGETTAVTLDLSTSATYVNFESATGGSAGDTLTGSATAGGTLSGGAGDDTITTGTGAATVITGAGADTVDLSAGTGNVVQYTVAGGVVADTASGLDTITGMVTTSDDIQFSGLVLGGTGDITVGVNVAGGGNVLLAANTGVIATDGTTVPAGSTAADIATYLEAAFDFTNFVAGQTAIFSVHEAGGLTATFGVYTNNNGEGGTVAADIQIVGTATVDSPFLDTDNFQL